MMRLPLTRTKQAGLLPDISVAALLGLVYGNIARSIPALATARVTNPGLYDAALGAAVVGTVSTLNAQPEQEESSPQQIIPPPGWNLM